MYRKGKLRDRQNKLSLLREAKGAKGHRGIREAIKKLEGLEGTRADRVRDMLAGRDRAERADRRLDGILAGERQ